jgi:hypothetical protein
VKVLTAIGGLTVTLVFAAPAFAMDGAQPLTRADCEKAGLVWDENANVCGGSDKAAESKKKRKKKKKGKHKKDQSRLKEEPS